MTGSGYRLVQLNNGGYSIHSLAHGETFHPVIGPVAEAEALYVRQLRLDDRLPHHTGEFVVWDVGLGAAANVLTLLRATRSRTCRLRVVSFDRTLEPLRFALGHAEALAYFQGYEEPAIRLAGGTGQVEFANGRQTVTWEVHVDDFPSWVARTLGEPAPPRMPRSRGGESAHSGGNSDQSRFTSAATVQGLNAPRPSSGQSQPIPLPIGRGDGDPGSARTGEGAPGIGSARDVFPAPHAILFDAFSPATNPEMWTLPLFTNLFRCLEPTRPCAMPTYSRSTMLRVTWLLAGFHVGTGHATGEKEETTIAANTLELIDEPLDRGWLARARRSTSAEPLREPVYRQARLRPETWDRLLAHPQFR